jgi:hypothetical protein
MPRHAVTAVCMAGLLLVAFGCDHEKTSCPGVCRGRIEGYVMGGDGPVMAWLEASYSAEGGPEISVRAMPDSATGYYQLPVPNGSYVVRAIDLEAGIWLYHSASGMTYRESQAQPVAVQGDPVRADFTGGGVTLDLDAPATLEGEYIHCRLQSLSDEGSRAVSEDRVSGGRAVIRFPLLPPGSYVAQITVNANDVWLPHGDLGSADTIDVVARRMTTYAVRVPSPAHILGTVRGSWQTMGTFEPMIYVHRTEDEDIVHGAVDSTGAFALELFAPGPVRLRVRFFTGPNRWVGGSDFAGATVFEVDSAQTLSGISVVESGIQCRLVGPPEDDLGHCAISLWDGDGRAILQDALVWDNPIPICDLDPGTYRLQVAPESRLQNWFARFYSGADSLSAATPIVISTAGETVPITLQLVVGGEISGRVTGSDGVPARYASVFLAPAADPAQVALAGETAGSRDPGAFTIPRLHTGDYKIGARSGAAPVTWYPGTAAWDSAGVIHVVEGNEVSGIDWRMRQ